MTYQFSANKRRAFSWWQMLLFIVLISGFLIILFPPKSLLNTLLYNSTPSDVSISYLKNLIAKDPSNTDLKLILAQQQFHMGKVQAAKKTILSFINTPTNSDIRWRTLWLIYSITRVEAFEFKEDDPKRAEKVAALIQMLPLLEKSPFLNNEDKASVADDALAFDQPYIANNLYKSLIQLHLKMSVSFYEKAGKAALYVEDYENSAQSYLAAMKASTSIDDKRFYFMKAVESLNFAGVAANTLAFAQKNIDGLKNDNQTLSFLANIALSASRQKDAQEYINQVLQLHYQDSSE